MIINQTELCIVFYMPYEIFFLCDVQHRSKIDVLIGGEDSYFQIIRRRLATLLFFLGFKLSNTISPQEKISSSSKLNFQALCRIDVSAFRIFVTE